MNHSMPERHAFIPPLETEAQARELPEVRAIRAAWRSNPARRPDADNARLITEACDRAGVELGAFDRRIVAWLAGFEATTCAVVAGLISRAASGT